MLNAGLLHRFTANGRLVHNCILLDHSGNIIRFADSFTEVFFNGLATLDSGEKLDNTIRKEPDDEQSVKKGCPQCGFKPFARRCMGCGFEVKVAATVEHAPGSMEEVKLGKGKVIDRQDLYRQCVAYARQHSAPEKQEWRAKYLYESMAGTMPPPNYKPALVPMDAQVSKDIRNKIMYANIRRAKARVQPGVEA